MTKKNLSKFAAALLGATCACDVPSTAGEPQEVQALRLLEVEPGGPWGPCKESCDGGFCLHSDAWESFCAPPCGLDGCPAQPLNMCGDPLIGRPTCNDAGACVAPCSYDSDCATGLVCSAELGICAWPAG